MKEIKKVSGKGIVIRGSDIDTDQIIPARYMKAVTFEGIEQYAFYDLRYDSEGNKKDHPFNDPKYKDSSILIVNANFGCGSSREHAPQTLMRSGIDAIIGESFAEIFAGNCTVLGVPIISLPKSDVEEIQSHVENDASVEIDIDITSSWVKVGDKTYKSHISLQAQHMLATGMWDITNVMAANETDIQRVYQSLPYIQNFT